MRTAKSGDSARTVGFVYFDNASSYTVAGSATLTLSVSSGTALIDVISGSHAIATPTLLASDTVINVEQSPSVLTMSGGISGSGALSKIGLGRQRLRPRRPD